MRFRIPKVQFSAKISIKAPNVFSFNEKSMSLQHKNINMIVVLTKVNLYMQNT